MTENRLSLIQKITALIGIMGLGIIGGLMSFIITKGLKTGNLKIVISAFMVLICSVVVARKTGQDMDELNKSGETKQE